MRESSILLTGSSVTLTQEGLVRPDAMAALRMKVNKRAGRRDTGGFCDADSHVKGLRGEYAAHLVTGLPWNKETSLEWKKMWRFPDVGPYHVRTALVGGDLVLRERDKQKAGPFLLVWATADLMSFEMKGVVRTKGLFVPEFVRNPGVNRKEAWFIPAARLHRWTPEIRAIAERAR